MQNPGKFSRVTLPETSEACYKTNTGDPTGGVNCDFPMQPLTKYRSTNLDETAGDAATEFFKSMTLSQAMLNELLVEYSDVLARWPGAYDGTDHFQAACTWLKAHPAVWKDWIAPPAP